MPNLLPTRRAQRGVTLLETLVSTAVLVIALTSSIPSFQDLARRRQLEGQALQLWTDLQFARSEAVARNESVRLSVRNTRTGSCYVVHTGAAGDCECGDSVPAACTDGAQEIKTVLLPERQPVRLQASAASVLFHPTRGTATLAGTFKLSEARGHALNVVVNSMGRVRACSPKGSMPGYKPC